MKIDENFCITFVLTGFKIKTNRDSRNIYVYFKDIEYGHSMPIPRL